MAKKQVTEEGNLPKFWDNDIDSKVDDEWADKVWKKMMDKKKKLKVKK